MSKYQQHHRQRRYTDTKAKHDDFDRHKQDGKRIVKEKFKQEKKYNIELVGKNKNQIKLLEYLKTKKLIIVRGNAGTGKTYLSTGYMCKELMNGFTDKLYITRSPIPVSDSKRSLGYFPGDINDKIDPWLAPVLGYMEDFLGKGTYECAIKDNKINKIPFETMRGRNFDNCICLVDEAQNLNLSELMCLTTRLAENGKLILCGDSRQNDLKNHDFDKFIEVLMKYDLNEVGIVTFTYKDCLRGNLCFELLRIFEEENW